MRLTVRELRLLISEADEALTQAQFERRQALLDALEEKREEEEKRAKNIDDIFKKKVVDKQDETLKQDNTTRRTRRDETVRLIKEFSKNVDRAIHILMKQFMNKKNTQELEDELLSKIESILQWKNSIKNRLKTDNDYLYKMLADVDYREEQFTPPTNMLKTNNQRKRTLNNMKIIHATDNDLERLFKAAVTYGKPDLEFELAKGEDNENIG